MGCPSEVRRRPRLRSLAAVAVVAGVAMPSQALAAGRAPVAAAAAVAPPATAGPTGQDLGVRARGIADEVVSRWASLQNAEGRFPDPISGSGGDYGTAMLGYAMLRRGVEQRDRGLIRGGLDALAAQVDLPAGGSFELLVLARAYRWASGVLPTDPLAAPGWASLGPRMAADLARRGPVTAQGAERCYADARCYNNLKLVSSLASVELLQTGLVAGAPDALLADPGLLGRVLHRAGSRVPREIGSDVSRSGAAPIGGGGVLSDPPRNPLAYHALSTAMLGELNVALGERAPDASLLAFDRAARAMLALAAPDGDLSWFGRGQGQVWVSAVVAEAAAQAARNTASPELRGRYLALVGASLDRLRTVYGVGASGLPLVPGAVDATTLAARSVDPYATTRGYNGLAVDALDRAAATLAALPDRATRVPSTRAGLVRSPQQSGVAAITKGPLWMAIAAKSRASDDARYGSGLLALQRRDAAGRWSPIVPGRPFAPTVVSTLAVRVDGRLLVPTGTVRPIARGAGVDSVGVLGAWTAPGGTSGPVDSGTAWTWRVVDASTVEVRFRAKKARTVVASGLVGDDATFRRVPFGFVVSGPDGGGVQYTLGVSGRRLPLARQVQPAGASAYDARVAVGSATAAVRRGEQVVLKIRVVSAPVAVPNGG